MRPFHEVMEERRIKVTALADWENGAAQPLPSQLRRLAFEFGCRSEDLQGERDENGSQILTNTYYISTDRKIAGSPLSSTRHSRNPPMKKRSLSADSAAEYVGRLRM
jgi:hypothetical protein